MHTGTFIAAPRLLTAAAFVQHAAPSSEQDPKLSSGEFVMFWPYWYRMTNDDGTLSLVGKTSLPLIDHVEKKFPVTHLHAEVETLLNDELPVTFRLIMIECPIVHVFPKRAGFTMPGTNVQEGDYWQYDNVLYRAKNGGRLSVVSKLNMEVDTFEHFAEQFKHITGLTVTDGAYTGSANRTNTPVTALDTEEDIDTFFKSLSREQQEQFMVQVAHMMGATKTHD